MTVMELTKQAEQINEQLYNFSKNAFEKALAAGIILDEQRDDDGDYVFLPTKTKYHFNGFDIDSKGIEIRGKVYAGCGDYDYTRTHTPFEYLDNLDAWIEMKKAEIADAAQKRAGSKAAKEAEERREAEAAERTRFLELKKKYEASA